MHNLYPKRYSFLVYLYFQLVKAFINKKYGTVFHSTILLVCLRNSFLKIASIIVNHLLPMFIFVIALKSFFPLKMMLLFFSIYSVYLKQNCLKGLNI